ncbi:hypothetical protein CMO91_04840 [Candidatus Woesearchaeota archaeon]|nr:hypothetical protein [Candidatus Woesearchaeota archaeon]
MWLLKTKMSGSAFPLAAVAMKFQIDFTGYPLSFYKDGKSIAVLMAGFMIGPDKDKEAAIRFLKQRKDIVHMERHGDFVVALAHQPGKLRHIYDPRIIRMSPSHLSKEGDVIWDMAAWDKQALLDVYNYAKKHHSASLMHLKQGTITNIQVAGIHPKITKKQKQALGLAIEHGYYEYPKKIGLVALAKKMKLSYSTFQAHLKKAEGKLLINTYKTL